MRRLTAMRMFRMACMAVAALFVLSLLGSLRTHRLDTLLGLPSAHAAECATASGTLPKLVFQQVAQGLEQPLHLTHAGDGSRRLFVVEQPGRVRVIRDGVLLPTPFLDITQKVFNSGEMGLLSVVFHPNFRTNGRFFVYYVESVGVLQSVVAEYHVSSGSPDIADPTEQVIMEVVQPFGNHLGGLLTFGPDGFLYVGLGDGGGTGDPQNNGQNLGTLLGKLLRIDVDGAAPYAIPPDNPFMGQRGARREIWAYGFRNPWRYSFDRCTGRLFAGDVGQASWEEVDLVTKGRNYGWRIMEGAHCYQPPSGCNQTGLELPIAEYDHALGCSVTGGFVYRGARQANLIARYLFGDFCTGRVWVLTESPGGWTRTELTQTTFLISSFGEDEQGELYLVDYFGQVYRITTR